MKSFFLIIIIAAVVTALAAYAVQEYVFGGANAAVTGGIAGGVTGAIALNLAQRRKRKSASQA